MIVETGPNTPDKPLLGTENLAARAYVVQLIDDDPDSVPPGVGPYCHQCYPKVFDQALHSGSFWVQIDPDTTVEHLPDCLWCGCVINPADWNDEEMRRVLQSVTD